jgi:leader peptidase (prepilin peptidase)/N-methyltransferase
MYPAVEIVTALVFAVTYLTYGLTLLSVVRVIFACALIVLFVTDLQHKILPNVITLPGIVIGFACSVFLPPGWVSSLIGVLVGGGVLFAIAEVYYRVRGQEGLGMGDVKLLAMIGAFLGWKLVLLTLVFASFTGSLAGGVLIASGRGGMKYALPFGTFLAVGALLAATWGNPIADWYFGFYQ